MKVIKFFVSLLVAILFIAFVITFPYCVATKDTLLKKEFMIDGLREAGIVDEIKSTIDKETSKFLNNFEIEMKNQITENLKQNVPPGVDVEQYVDLPDVNNTVQTAKKEVTNVLNKFNSNKNIENVMNIIVETVYEQKEISFEEESINKELKDLVNDVVEDNNIKLSDEASKEIDNFIDELSGELNKEIVSNFKDIPLTNGRGDVIINPLPIAISAINMACAILLVIIIILFGIILLLDGKKIYNGFLKTSIWILISGLVIKVANIIATTAVIDEIHKVKEGGIINFVENTIKKMVNVTDRFFIMYMIIAAILLVISIILRIILKRNKDVQEA